MGVGKRIQAFKRFREATREDRLGDAALLKVECFGGGGTSESIERQLRALGPFPDVDPAPLRDLPRGTLGREYVELLDANGLSPFRLSSDFPQELVDRHIFVARYSLVHDVFHVLTGFDTTWAGELGVWSFVAAQGYARSHWLAVGMASALYPWLAPRSIPRQWRNLHRGISMGRRARPLLTVPFEQMWSRTVAEVRHELEVEPADELTELVAE